MSRLRRMAVICVDFDGTCVTHAYPAVGEDIGAASVLRDLVKEGNKLILFTMRSGQHLEEAVQWFKDNGIELFGINRNPTQDSWTSSPKAYGEIYIDDAALGCPLMDWGVGERPFVDWVTVRELLRRAGCL